MDIIIYTPTEDQFIKEISFNHEEIKKELAIRIEKYKGLVYADDSIKAAKADRATLNKFKDALEAKRKELKKQCMAPYEAFEIKMKEILALVDEPIMAIDAQIKAYEAYQKETKLDSIKSYFEANVGDLAVLVPWKRVFNTKWLNATYKEADIQKEINALLAQVQTDIQVITDLKSEYELQIKSVYLNEFNLSAALQEAKRLDDQAKKMAEYNRIQAERQAEKERQAAEAQRQADEAQRMAEEMEQAKVHLVPAVELADEQPQAEPPIVKAEDPPPAPPETETIYAVDFRVQATREQLALLKRFLMDNRIQYGRVQ